MHNCALSQNCACYSFVFSFLLAPTITLHMTWKFVSLSPPIPRRKVPTASTSSKALPTKVIWYSPPPPFPWKSLFCKRGPSCSGIKFHARDQTPLEPGHIQSLILALGFWNQIPCLGSNPTNACTYAIVDPCHPGTV